MNDNKEYMDCGMLIKLISDHIQSHSNKQLNKANLTATQFRYLEYLNRHGSSVTFKDAEKHFQASQPTVSGIMRRLSDKKLIVVEASEFGRAKNARLTEKGKMLMNESGAERDKEEKFILSALQEDEREVFHDMLERINKKLSK